LYLLPLHMQGTCCTSPTKPCAAAAMSSSRKCCHGFDSTTSPLRRTSACVGRSRAGQQHEEAAAGVDHKPQEVDISKAYWQQKVLLLLLLLQIWVGLNIVSHLSHHTLTPSKLLTVCPSQFTALAALHAVRLDEDWWGWWQSCCRTRILLSWALGSPQGHRYAITHSINH
jgi:hypothetical protein